MQNDIRPTMTWDEAPDTIDYMDLSKILGVCPEIAKNKFDERGFPKISGLGTKRKADKEAAKLYIQGLYDKGNLRDSRQNLILLELKKITSNFKLMKGEWVRWVRNKSKSIAS